MPSTLAARGPVFMRSLATRDFGSEISAALPDVIAACKVAGFDLIVVETSGIGQGDAAIVPHVDVPMYVMTPEFGAASQLEKIDMLDFAEFVAINKFDRKGALDALRDVAKQVQRNKEAWTTPPEQMPVFGTMAARFNDDGVTALYQASSPSAGTGPATGEAQPARGERAPQHQPDARWCRPRAPATWPKSATRCAATRKSARARPDWPARSSSCANPCAC
jgi:methylmalonyl-CoA mutase